MEFALMRGLSVFQWNKLNTMAFEMSPNNATIFLL